MTRSWKQSILFPGTQLLWNQNEALAFVRWLRFYLFILSKYWYISACTIRLQHLLFSCYREHFFLRCILTPSKFLFVHNPQGTQCNAVNIIKQRLEALKISKVLFWENNYQDIFCLQRVKPTSNHWASTRFTEYHQSTISTLFWGSKLWIVLRPEKKQTNKTHLSSKQNIIPDVSGTKNLDIWAKTGSQILLLKSCKRCPALNCQEKEGLQLLLFYLHHGSTHFFEWHPKQILKRKEKYVQNTHTIRVHMDNL